MLKAFSVYAFLVNKFDLDWFVINIHYKDSCRFLVSLNMLFIYDLADVF